MVASIDWGIESYELSGVLPADWSCHLSNFLD